MRQLKLAWAGLVGDEHILALQHHVEEHEHFGVKEGGADAVVVPLKQAQLLVLPSVLGQQPLTVPLGYKGVVPGVPWPWHIMYGGSPALHMRTWSCVIPCALGQQPRLLRFMSHLYAVQGGDVAGALAEIAAATLRIDQQPVSIVGMKGLNTAGAKSGDGHWLELHVWNVSKHKRWCERQLEEKGGRATKVQSQEYNDGGGGHDNELCVILLSLPPPFATVGKMMLKYTSSLDAL